MPSPGGVDAGRVPLAALSAKFTQRGEQLALDDLVAALPGGGRARGSGTLDFTADAPMTWALDVDNLDLRQLHSKLATTRLHGTLAADLDSRRQRITGNVADRRLGLALTFAANVAERRVEITRARLAAREGTLEGSGRVALDGAQPFAFTAEARRLDPSRFVDAPAGSLDGNIRVEGTLAPAWRADVEVKIAPGSKLAGLVAGGGAKATLTASTVSSAAIDVRLGATKLVRAWCRRRHDRIHARRTQSRGTRAAGARARPASARGRTARDRNAGRRSWRCRWQGEPVRRQPHGRHDRSCRQGRSSP